MDDQPMFIEDHVIPIFYKDAKLDSFATAAAQKVNPKAPPVFKNVDMIKIMVPGDPKSIAMHEVKPHHVYRFPKAYDAFECGTKTESGTPLDKADFINPAQRNMLKAVFVATVEQLAACGDGVVDNLGHGGRELRDKAVAWVSGSAAAKLNADLQARNDKQEARIAKLEKLLAAQADEDAVPERRSRKKPEVKEQPAPEGFSKPGEKAPDGFSSVKDEEIPPHMRSESATA